MFNELPLKPLAILCSIIFLEPFSMTILFPFIYFMIRDFQDIPDDEIGLWCGLVTAAASLGQSISSIFFGYLSDRYGRRVMLLTGLFLSSTAAVIFGLSKSTTMALLTRFICGCCSATIPIAKSAMNEISTRKTRPFIFSLLGITWSIGMILGPSIGGLFSSPTEHFPTLFKLPLFIEYPYLLPCLIQAAVGFTTAILGYWLLPETAMHLGGVYHIIATMDDVEDDAPASPRPLSPSTSGHPNPTIFSPDPASTIFLDTSNTRLEFQDTIRRLSSRHSSFATTEELFDAQSEGFLTEDHLSSNESEDEVYIPPEYCLFSTHVIVSYGILHFMNMFFEEIYSLWAVAPLGIGLGLTSESLGILIFFVGATSFIFAIFYPSLARPNLPARIVFLYRMAYPFYMAVWIMLPLITLSLRDNTALWIQIVLFLALAFRRLANVLAFTSSNILLQTSANPMNIGWINGLASAFAAFLRTLAPIVAGVLWSFSTVEGNAPPFGGSLVFFVLFLISVVGLSHSFLLTV